MAPANNAYTNSIPDVQELCNIINNMCSNASPGPDGLNAAFYKSAWTWISQDVHTLVKKDLCAGSVYQLHAGGTGVHSDQQDILRWTPSKNGQCTTKNVYRHLSQQQLVQLPKQGSRSINPEANNILQRAWKSKQLSPLIKAFTWRLIRRALATADRAASVAASRDDGQIAHHAQDETNIQANRPNIQIPALITGIRCYVDASTTPDHPSLPPRRAGLGMFFVNTQVQPAQTIYIKAKISGVHSVLMAEAAALALAAALNEAFTFNNTTFLSDCQQLVDFLNQNDHTHPLDWRIKSFTQIFDNCSAQRHAQIFKINRNLNSTADSLARQALSASGSSFEPACSYLHHLHQCPLPVAVSSVNMQAVTILSASCS